MFATNAVAPVARRERTEAPAALRAEGAGRVIGLAAHVGLNNIGDDMLFASALEHYRRRLPGARFVAFTMNVDDTKARHGVDEAYPIRPPRRAAATSGTAPRIVAYLRDIFALAAETARELTFSIRAARRLRGLDLLIVTGSSQFIDAYGGPWCFPFTLLRWTILARLTGVPICFLSMGAESVTYPLSRWMIRRTVHLADVVTVRDAVSRTRLLEQGVRRPLPVVPDLALAYPVSTEGERARQTGARTLGINPIPYYHQIFWRAVDEQRYRRYIAAMTALTMDALQRGHRVVLYAMVEWADRVPAQEIVEEIRKRCGAEAIARISTPEVNSFEDLWSVLSGVDWVVASRYHGVVTALLMGKPVIGLAYEEKTADLMTGSGVGAYAIEIERADGPQLSALLDRLESNDETIRATLDASARASQAMVTSQYNDVFEKHVLNRAKH